MPGENSTRFLLDTNILSELIRNPSGIVRDRIEKEGEDSIAVSIVVAAELRFGAAKRRSERLSEHVEAILLSVTILPLEEPVDRHYAEIRASLEASGNPIGPNDLLIAAHARALGLTVVTANVAEFSKVPGLAVTNWLHPKAP
ncbi:type II toxin-antitoxin system VapC family toxin [Luteolibacter sp. Populi]|uniref:type II toxin-antitoxin system VapC family toxin n=1 Tax=Luteolibacter sp. Populi TaxID=3230487 RepID=UPI003467CE26